MHSGAAWAAAAVHSESEPPPARATDARSHDLNGAGRSLLTPFPRASCNEQQRGTLHKAGLRQPRAAQCARPWQRNPAGLGPARALSLAPPRFASAIERRRAAAVAGDGRVTPSRPRQMVRSYPLTRSSDCHLATGRRGRGVGGWGWRGGDHACGAHERARQPPAGRRTRPVGCTAGLSCHAPALCRKPPPRTPLRSSLDACARPNVQ
jgi:hypothetical protein